MVRLDDAPIDLAYLFGRPRSWDSNLVVEREIFLSDMGTAEKCEQIRTKIKAEEDTRRKAFANDTAASWLGDESKGLEEELFHARGDLHKQFPFDENPHEMADMLNEEVKKSQAALEEARGARRRPLQKQVKELLDARLATEQRVIEYDRFRRNIERLEKLTRALAEKAAKPYTPLDDSVRNVTACQASGGPTRALVEGWIKTVIHAHD